MLTSLDIFINLSLPYNIELEVGPLGVGGFEIVGTGGERGDQSRKFAIPERQLYLESQYSMLHLYCAEKYISSPQARLGSRAPRRGSNLSYRFCPSTTENDPTVLCRTRVVGLGYCPLRHSLIPRVQGMMHLPWMPLTGYCSPSHGVIVTKEGKKRKRKKGTLVC